MERVVDKSVIIDISRNNERVLEYLKENHKNTVFYLTAITVFELKCGKTTKIEEYYIEALKTLDFDTKSADIAAYIYKELSSRGLKPSLKDLFIASICIANRTPLITTDKRFKIFEEFGLEVEFIER